MSKVERVEESDFNGLIDFCSANIDGQIISFSDQYFADAVNLINPAAPIRRAGYYVPTGAWFDGWETRRHNKAPTDWVIIKLGVTGEIHGCEVDTAFFNGNEAPAVSLDACTMTESQEAAFREGKGDETVQWDEILPKTPCGPSQRHFFRLSHPVTNLYTHVRLHQHPDGGIARFRLYGKVIPRFPQDKDELLDLASVKNGAVAIACSDQHFGKKENLLLPGRGKDMGDGWETARSRAPGHFDWVIVQLGARMKPKEIVVDTAFFRGNFPQHVKVFGAEGPNQVEWILLAEGDTQADFIHTYPVDGHASSGPITHVKLCIYPDGGVKRLRVLGTRV